MHPYNFKEYYFLSELKEQGHILNGALLSLPPRLYEHKYFSVENLYSPAISCETICRGIKIGEKQELPISHS